MACWIQVDEGMSNAGTGSNSLPHRTALKRGRRRWEGRRARKRAGRAAGRLKGGLALAERAVRRLGRASLGERGKE